MYGTERLPLVLPRPLSLDSDLPLSLDSDRWVCSPSPYQQRIRQQPKSKHAGVTSIVVLSSAAEPQLIHKRPETADARTPACYACCKRLTLSDIR